MSALIFADDRPTSCDDDLYQWAVDAEELIRDLHTENTALRVTEENLLDTNAQLLAALTECVDDSRQAVADYVVAYGENWRPARLKAMRATVANAEAAIARAEQMKERT